ncbi:MAG: class I SAM-dependent methyltransferase [Candidatus Riflebacteria bacterium]|nr:class I SAM-dependent methyltransferase [Candidatus Riflebacteria bacterium]
MGSHAIFSRANTTEVDMSLPGKARALAEVLRAFAGHPWVFAKLLRQLPRVLRGFTFAEGWEPAGPPARGDTGLDSSTAADPENPLVAFLRKRETGRGIWKWMHYLDVYHRHLRKFVGKEVHVLEVGIHSGGSLEMWRDYFGPKCHLYGVDIEPACACYENDHTKVFVGSQADRGLWQTIRQRVPALDVLIDDGGHETEQQIVTIEEMLPHLRLGGVYVCEDIHGEYNGFSAYVQGLVANLHAMLSGYEPDVKPAPIQSYIGSVHIYPYLTVVEKVDSPVSRLVSARRGTEWQPFG